MAGGKIDYFIPVSNMVKGVTFFLFYSGFL
jgi:hypothetical protein